MSSATCPENVIECPPVMVCAYGQEPVQLRAVAKGAGVIEVASDDGLARIGFREADVYQFDARLFGQLQSAHAAGDFARLDKLWKSAQRFNSLH